MKKKKINRSLGFIKTDWTLEFVLNILKQQPSNTVYVKRNEYHYQGLQIDSYQEVLTELKKENKSVVFYMPVGINTKTFEVEMLQQNGGLGLFGTAYEEQFRSLYYWYKQKFISWFKNIKSN